eukprot:12917-Prymnesium_polylepis.2
MAPFTICDSWRGGLTVALPHMARPPSYGAPSFIWHTLPNMAGTQRARRVLLPLAEGVARRLPGGARYGGCRRRGRHVPGARPP